MTVENNGGSADNSCVVDGHVHSDFEDLKRIFRENFIDGLEKAGAAFAVWRNGELIVDLWGGEAAPLKPWAHDTLSVLFSTTKSISALILAYVLDKEGVNYGERVTKFWPEFGQHGKDKLTILQVTLHQAGLPYGETHVTQDDVKDWKRMSKVFENMRPVWTPGTKAGYHALTFGFLLDQLVRRIDSRKRGINDILEELCREYGITDLHIGLPQASVNERVAIIRAPNADEVEEEGARCPEALKRYKLGDNEHNAKLYDSWWWITVNDYNKLENRLLAMPSNMGLGNARALAQLHSLLTRDGFLSEKTMRLFGAPILVEEMDIVNGYPESKGYGFQFTKNPKGRWVFGHSGFGGQNVRVDVDERLSWAYVCNGLKVADADLVEPFARLTKRLYQLLPTSH